jgi:hypothetical protein
MANYILPVASIWFRSFLLPFHAQLATAIEQIVELWKQTL